MYISMYMQVYITLECTIILRVPIMYSNEHKRVLDHVKYWTADGVSWSNPIL